MLMEHLEKYTEKFQIYVKNKRDKQTSYLEALLVSFVCNIVLYKLKSLINKNLTLLASIYSTSFYPTFLNL